MACGSSSASSAGSSPPPLPVACLADDLPALTVHLAYPLRLKKRLRSTNLLSVNRLMEGRKKQGGLTVEQIDLRAGHHGSWTTWRWAVSRTGRAT
jgi:hypothetical protein